MATSGDFDMGTVEDNPDFPITNEFRNDHLEYLKECPMKMKLKKCVTYWTQIGESKENCKRNDSQKTQFHKAFELAQSRLIFRTKV